MLMRRYWHGAKEIERSLKRVNSPFNNYVLKVGQCVNHHSNIRASEMIDLTNLTYPIWDMIYTKKSYKEGIETFLSSHNIRRLPEFKF